MATYDKDTKFYYLQVKENFFDDDAIEWLEDRENGEKYSNFYLKLCLKSLKTNGILIKKVGTMLIPYDSEALRKLTKTKDIDTVKVAMDLLIKSGLVQLTDERAIYISQLENLIGSKSLGALKKQQQRDERNRKQLLELNEGQEGDNCPPKIYIKQELKLELDKDIDIYSFDESKQHTHQVSNEDKVLSKKELENILTEEFQILWDKYPNKQGKQNALKSYIKSRTKDKVEYTTIENGLNKYLMYCKQNKWYSPKNGSTWFNQQSWNDEYTLKQPTTKDLDIDISDF